MEVYLEAVLVIVISVLMSVLSYHLGLLTYYGACVSVLTGSVVGVFGSIWWFTLLMLFTVAGFAATRVGFFRKKAAGLQEGKKGERTHMNVLGVGIAPCIIAVLHYVLSDDYSDITAIGFIASIAVAAADTIASEIGVKDKNVILCTTLKRVPPGTDGGISLFGTLTALFGSLFVSLLGWAVIFGEFDILIVIPVIAGLAGCFADSFLGATLETKKVISKYTNNASTGLMGALLAMAVAWFFL